jgi:hypothetical protein
VGRGEVFEQATVEIVEFHDFHKPTNGAGRHGANSVYGASAVICRVRLIDWIHLSVSRDAQRPVSDFRILVFLVHGTVG